MSHFKEGKEWRATGKRIGKAHAAHDHDPRRGGLVPFRLTPDGEIEFLLQKPKPTEGHPEGAPKFQLIRSERIQVRKGSSFHEETPYETALRSGHTEGGVLRKNIRRVIDLGVYETVGITGDVTGMHLYAAELRSAKTLPPTKSQAAKWMTQKDAGDIREKHLPILQDIERELKRRLAYEKGGRTL